ncbi:MAG: tetratricopeptide repeat protein [Myxococcota bacterium]
MRLVIPALTGLGLLACGTPAPAPSTSPPTVIAVPATTPGVAAAPAAPAPAAPTPAAPATPTPAAPAVAAPAPAAPAPTGAATPGLSPLVAPLFELGRVFSYDGGWGSDTPIGDDGDMEGESSDWVSTCTIVRSRAADPDARVAVMACVRSASHPSTADAERGDSPDELIWVANARGLWLVDEEPAAGVGDVVTAEPYLALPPRARSFHLAATNDRMEGDARVYAKGDAWCVEHSYPTVDGPDETLCFAPERGLVEAQWSERWAMTILTLKGTGSGGARDHVASARKAGKARRWPEAIDELRAALALDDAPPIQGELGWALFNAGRLDEARTTTEAALARTTAKGSRGALLYNLGRIDEAQGKRADAIDHYQASLTERANKAVQKRLDGLRAAATP